MTSTAADAWRALGTVLRLASGNADAPPGLRLAYYHADRPVVAARRAEAALRIAPANQELRDVLERVKASS